MQKSIQFYFAVMLMTGLVFAQSGWVWQNPYPQGHPLNDVFVFDANTAIAVGEVGTVMKTTDGGVTWEFQHHIGGTSNNLIAVDFVDQQTGWILGHYEDYNSQSSGSILMKTSDGAVRWDSIYCISNTSLNALQFINEHIGYVAGSKDSPDSSLAIVYKTIDGGISWDSLTIEQVDCIESMSFINADTGWAVAWVGVWDKEVLKTTDGGVSWDSIYSASFIDKIYFVNSDTGWLTYGVEFWGFFTSKIYKTIDGGFTWNEQYSVVLQEVYGFILSIMFKDTETGWAAGYKEIHRTTNGGDTWESHPIEYDLQLNSVCFTGDTMGWAVGELGTIVKSSDGGSTWESQSTIVTDFDAISSVHFVDNQIGWAAGSNSVNAPHVGSYSYGIIVNTTDGGITWEEQFRSGGHTDFTSIFFVDHNIGYAVGWSGMEWNNLHSTTDGGQTWYKPSPLLAIALHSVYFTSADTGFGLAGGNVGNIGVFKTTDSGTSWALVYPEQNLSCIFFADALNGWVVGREGTLIHTTDGGNNWSPQNSGVTEDFSAVFFTDAANGWIAGSSGILLHSSDSGNSWTPQSSGTTESLDDICFADDSTGWIVGSGGTILHTEDVGTTWTPQYNVTNQALFSVYFTDAFNGWAVGDHGTILNTTTGGVVSIEEETRTDPGLANSFQLYQNYPNPFNLSTTIEFALPKAAFATLTIYNIIGEKVATLISQNLTAGSYQYQWEARGLASGVYFYRLEAEDFSETKKLLLLR